MSFSRDVKLEICQNTLSGCCKKAFISAIIKHNSFLIINNKGINFNISFENATIIKNIYEMLKEIYNIEPQILATKQMKLMKRNRYTLKIGDYSLNILNDLKLLDGFSIKDSIDKEYYNNECCKKAYISGSFVAGGSVNSPTKTKYHLEIQSENETYLKNLLKLINTLNTGRYPLGINFKLSKRRNKYLIYLKSAREIVDFLNYMNATNTTFYFEDVRVRRDYFNSINRVNNMEVANELKTQKAAKKQLEAIKQIESKLGLDKLDIKLRKIAEIRKENEEASLVELCEIYNHNNLEKITKSGMNHRLRKINEIANQINVRGE